LGQHHEPLPRQAEGRDLSGADDPAPSNASTAVSGAAAGEASSFDEAALEAGRLLFAGEWVFLRACHAVDQLPPAGPPEVAFAGRSNVGKSTLLNALTGRKQLARSSNTPGRTRALNLFARSDGEGPVVVDMPGYGYAKAPKTEVAAWTALVFDYLRGRPNLRRLFLLVDARHGPKATDLEAMKTMDEAAVSYQAVLTKADKAGKDLKTNLAATQKALARRPAAHPEVLVTSANTSRGMPELRATIAALMV
jgi:GTP-binding protein